MNASKHSHTKTPSDADLKDDPGIGRSRGIQSPSDDEMLNGDNTVEGDAANDATPAGGVDPADRGRTNR